MAKKLGILLLAGSLCVGCDLVSKPNNEENTTTTTKTTLRTTAKAQSLSADNLKFSSLNAHHVTDKKYGDLEYRYYGSYGLLIIDKTKLGDVDVKQVFDATGKVGKTIYKTILDSIEAKMPSEINYNDYIKDLELVPSAAMEYANKTLEKEYGVKVLNLKILNVSFTDESLAKIYKIDKENNISN